MVTGDVDADAVVDVTVCVDAGTEDVVEVIVDVCAVELVVLVSLEEVVVPEIIPVTLELGAWFDVKEVSVVVTGDVVATV